MDFCQEKIIHEKNVQQAIKKIPTPEIVQIQADTFRALGDPSRLKIVLALRATELCVCDISAVCSLSESAVSHQLRILRNLRIVSNRREGKIVFYRLNDNHVSDLLQLALEHVQEENG
jgi:ArsR family transcriptional regulator